MKRLIDENGKVRQFLKQSLNTARNRGKEKAGSSPLALNEYPDIRISDHNDKTGYTK